MISSVSSVSVQTSAVFAERALAARSGAAGSAVGASNDATTDAPKSSVADPQLSAQQLQQIAELRQTDRLVRAHEQAHIAAGAGLVRSGAVYSYATGPDDKRYAVGGEVAIDTSPGSTPEQTLAKAQQIRAAALAPADPSAQDRSVAALAARMASDARAEIRAAFLARSSSEAEGGAGTSSADAYRAVASAGDVGSVPGARVDAYA